MTKCLQCFVSGRVQGVWFRASTKREAEALGLTGYVRNLPDGRVEAMICGSDDAVEKMQAWLRHGPERAEVTSLEVTEVSLGKYSSFLVLS